MKTTQDVVIVTEVDQNNQEHEVQKRIKDENNRLMVDRIISIFSKYPGDRIKYSESLENEIYHEYRSQLDRGMMITAALQDENVTKEYYDAIYGENRDAVNPYLTFARSQVSASTDCLSGNENPSKQTLELQQKMVEMLDHNTGATLIPQALKARRRLYNFNKRHTPDLAAK